MGDLRVTLKDGDSITLAQMRDYMMLIDATDDVGDWHFCENGCCMVIHSKENREEFGYMIGEEGGVEKCYADGRVEPFPIGAE